MKRIFFSYSKPISNVQKEIISYIKHELLINNNDVIEVNSKNYSNSPLYRIDKAIKNCNCFLCIALEKRTVEKKDNSIEYYTSPWLDIEIALAISSRLPIFIIKEEKISNTALLSNEDSVSHFILPNRLNKRKEIDLAYFKKILVPRLVEWLSKY